MDPTMTMPMWRGRPRPRISRMLLMSMRSFHIPAILTKKRHEPEPEHIKGREECGNQSHQPINPARLICPPQNLVLAEKACERRNTGDGDGGERHRPERPGNFSTQAAHLAHVLLAA